ncbi:chaperone protein dnaJ A6, chloroplastic-like [Carica papaya]|uniref:chaperone protein dnaJ A6, chloroplastic-like n=1 Tax=Carica papaya TaxID=3649 RepID=UPI000B8CF15E|nr:chaperone protein dnaJ A6, chloroplastic-like [Carica papaya]
MAIIQCGSTWVAQWGIRPQFMLRPYIARRISTPQYGVTSRISDLSSSSSSLFSRDSLPSLSLRGMTQSSQYRKGARFIVKADADYYSVLGVSKNASKSEIKSGKLILFINRWIEEKPRKK